MVMMLMMVIVLVVLDFPTAGQESVWDTGDDADDGDSLGDP